MSAQRLSDRKARRITRALDEDVIRAWVWGSHDWYVFVTRDHRHGSFNHKTGEVQWESPEAAIHFTTCGQIDPSEPSGYRPETTERRSE